MAKNTELHLAILNSSSEDVFLGELNENLEMARDLLNLPNGSGDTPLMFAIVKQYPRVVKRFLELGADPLARKNDTGASVLELASSGRDFGILASIVVAIKKISTASNTPSSLLQDQVRTPNKKGYTPLHHAAKKCNFGACRLLLQLGADASVRNDDGSTPLLVALECSNHIDLMTEERRKEVLECCELLCKSTGTEFRSILKKPVRTSSASNPSTSSSKNKKKNKIKPKKRSIPTSTKSSGDNTKEEECDDTISANDDQIESSDDKTSEPIVDNSSSFHDNVLVEPTTISITTPTEAPPTQSPSSATRVPPLSSASPTNIPPPGLPHKPSSNPSQSRFRPQTQSETLRKAMRKVREEGQLAAARPSNVTKVQPKSSTKSSTKSSSTPPTSTNAWKTQALHPIEVHKQTVAQQTPTIPSPHHTSSQASPFNTAQSSLSFLSDEIMKLSLEQDEDQRYLTTSEIEGLGSEIRLKRMEELTQELHPLAETLVIQPENVLGEGIEGLSMAQLTALEEIHHQQLAKITECRVQLARREERVKQQEKTLLTLEMLRRKLTIQQQSLP